MHYDVTILTAAKYVSPTELTPYIRNVLYEDELVKNALQQKGLSVARKAWDDNAFDWSATKVVLFRTVWDYFDRFPEFSRWFKTAKAKTRFINPPETIYWNIDKHYLADLEKAGVRIVPTLFIETGDRDSLVRHFSRSGWQDAILKPAVSGAARHTYQIDPANVAAHERIFRRLIAEEAMMLQPFQHSILQKGEVSHMLFEGRYSHSVLKKAKAGDFRVQDDFGGSVHEYEAGPDEIAFAEKAVSVCKPSPIYARVDVVWDNHNQLALAELELIEPELWFRVRPQAAQMLADSVAATLE